MEDRLGIPCCTHCGAHMPGGHTEYCRENIPLAERVSGYVRGLFAMGYQPDDVIRMLNPEEVEAMKSLRNRVVV